MGGVMAKATFGVSGILLAILAGCVQGGVPADRYLPDITISASAWGWAIAEDSQGDTILVNPSGEQFNVGKTQYPDLAVRSYLWRISVPKFHEDFLVLYAPPAASASNSITLLKVDPGNKPVWVATVDHHYELGFRPNQAREVKVDWVDCPEGILLADILFQDSDGDGIPELKEMDVYRWEGHITYYRWDGNGFVPLWREEYKAPEDASYDLKLISRVKLRP